LALEVRSNGGRRRAKQLRNPGWTKACLVELDDRFPLITQLQPNKDRKESNHLFLRRHLGDLLHSH
jgi:hypothetical protein